MQERNIPQTYWAEVIHTTIHILNKAHLIPNYDKAPNELWHGKPTSIKHFKQFGSKCHIKNNDEKLGKFDPRVDEGIFLGYSIKIKGCMCYNKILHNIFDCIYVNVDEELPIKNKKTCFINPQDHGIREEEEEQVEDAEETKTHLKSSSWHVQKNQLEDQTTGDKNVGVQTRMKLVQTTNQAQIAMLSMIELKRFFEAIKDKQWINGMTKEVGQI